MSDLTNNPTAVVTETAELKLEVVNGDVPSSFYARSPCLIGFNYIRFEVSGEIAPCCIAKHRIGSAYDQDWRDVWFSGAYENFRKKMARIHVDRFHLTDPEWTFCQQCSHLDQNQQKNKLLEKNDD
jgi:hypothetical protein